MGYVFHWCVYIVAVGSESLDIVEEYAVAAVVDVEKTERVKSIVRNGTLWHTKF